MRIEIVFPRTRDGQRVETYEVETIPRIGECITSDGGDCWDVQTVLHCMPTPLNSQWQKTGVVAVIGIR